MTIVYYKVPAVGIYRNIIYIRSCYFLSFIFYPFRGLMCELDKKVTFLYLDNL